VRIESEGLLNEKTTIIKTKSKQQSSKLKMKIINSIILMANLSAASAGTFRGVAGVQRNLDSSCSGVVIINNCGGDTGLYITDQVDTSTRTIESGACQATLGTGFRVVVGPSGTDAIAAGNTLFEGTYTGSGLMYWDVSALSGFNYPVMAEFGNGVTAELATSTTCGTANSGVFPCNAGQDCASPGPWWPATCPGCSDTCCDHIPGQGTCDPAAIDPTQVSATVTFCY
jgi:hypothetical protein